MPILNSQKINLFVRGRIIAVLAFLAAAIELPGCAAHYGPAGGGAQTQLELFQKMEIYLPLMPDSVIARYQRYDSAAFLKIHESKLNAVLSLIDSLNGQLTAGTKIETLSIDHSAGALLEAGRRGKSVYISSSYFIIYDDVNVLRYIVFHEFGHLKYDLLGAADIEEIGAIWKECRQNALLYLFHDAEYSGNARIGGHPDESPEEMYASAFNILSNNANEFRSRVNYIDSKHLGVISRIERMIFRK